MRQCGSMPACQAATCCESQSSPPTAFAIQPQPVRIETKPSGTATPSSGTTNAFAERPEIPTR